VDCGCIHVIRYKHTLKGANHGSHQLLAFFSMKVIDFTGCSICDILVCANFALGVIRVIRHEPTYLCQTLIQLLWPMMSQNCSNESSDIFSLHTGNNHPKMVIEVVYSFFHGSLLLDGSNWGLEVLELIPRDF